MLDLQLMFDSYKKIKVKANQQPTQTIIYRSNLILKGRVLYS